MNNALTLLRTSVVCLLGATIAIGVIPASARAAGNAAPVELTSTLFKQMKWRSVGPANMGGRVSSIAVDPVKPYTIYVGLGTGGVMKTTDNGVSWQGIFERESVASIGAIAVAPTDPNTVWVGTGESNGRNSSSWGDGIYQSTDAGATWTHRGLRDSHNISKVIIDPTNPRIVYAAVMGHLWGASKERGVFKTTDGGTSWSQVLQIDETTGCIDLAIDPANSAVLYAAMYHRLRKPWSFSSGGAVGGIYKTVDAGRTWKKLAGGLPAQTGRIGLDVYRADPRIVYSVIESDIGGQSSAFDDYSSTGGVFRSEDGGQSWKRMNDLAPRSFYFSQIRVDPADDKRVYVLGYQVHVSDDGGRTFRDDGARDVHVDHHAMWIDPKNTDHLLLGNDGGFYASYSRSKSWDFFNNMAIGEFYRITTDMARPYRIAGGLQDNNNWIGVSATRTVDGITNADWKPLGGGDGFSNVIDRENPQIIYAESQEGEAYRLHLGTGQIKAMRPSPKEGSQAFRFHWNAPLLQSHHDASVLYLGGNRVFRFSERGEKWEAISGDLSAQDPARIMTVGSGAENYGVVYTLAESPLRKGLLWAGTDDGKVWMTKDDGATWTDLTPALPKSVKGLWMSRIDASRFDEGTAYLAVDGHTSDQFAPYALMTADAGRTWTSITGDLPAGNPVKVLREDPRSRNVLYAGTEFGIYFSIDRGAKWTKLDSGLPTVAVDDIVVHPRDADLIIGTHGRSIYVMDDIRPLQELTAEVLAKPAHLFTPRTAIEFHWLPEGAMWSKRIFKAENPPFGAIINYYIRTYTGEDVALEISETGGSVVRHLTGTTLPGVNRVIWDLKLDKEMGGDRTTPSGQPRFVKPGKYTVALTMGKTRLTQELVVEAVEGLVPE